MSAREQWTARFDALVQSRNEPAWMTALRKKAWDRFLELGLPTRRDERWKYTSLLAFGRNPFVTPERITSELSFEVDGIEAVATLSHINGITHLGSSDLGRLGVEITVRPLAEAWEDAREALERRCEAIQDGVQALQFAFATDGAIVFIGNDVEMTAPIRLTRRTHLRPSSTTLSSDATHKRSSSSVTKAPQRPPPPAASATSSSKMEQTSST